MQAFKVAQHFLHGQIFRMKWINALIGDIPKNRKVFSKEKTGKIRCFCGGNC